jgi:predicted flap endonuclease-1-like 5' DNA nuclease
MNFWTALILGLLAGWLIEWVIDWLFWRRARLQEAEPSLVEERLRIDLEASVAARRNAETRLAQATAALEAARASQGRLEADLSGANELAARHKADLDALQARFDAERARPAAGEGARTLTSGTLGGASSGMETVRLDAVTADDEGERLRAELAALHAELARVKAAHADRLIDINGIGPVYERRLFDAGIYTFEELAASSHERLREIIGPEGWQNIDPAAWTAEARELAAKARDTRRAK